MSGRAILIAVLICLMTFIAVAGLDATAANQPRLLDFAPAHPKTLPPFSPGKNRPRLILEQMAQAIIIVDASGKVVSVTSETKQDSLIIQFVAPYLTSLDFEPARSGTEARISILPVKIQMSPQITSPDFHFPVDTAALIADQDLLIKTLKANEVYPPRLTFFPAYYSPFESDTSAAYGFVLVRLALSEKGELTDLKIERSTCPSCDWMTRSAALYARYLPAAVNGGEVPSEGWLLVSLFPQLSYPTFPWAESDSTSASLLARYQARLIPIRDGLLSPPLPRFIPADNCPMTAVERMEAGPVAVAVRIDSLGRAAVRRTSGGDQRSQKSVSRYVKKLKFYPAMDFNGKPESFDGLLRFDKIDKQTVRITYSWLPYTP